jgi:hypothetical protein
LKLFWALFIICVLFSAHADSPRGRAAYVGRFVSNNNQNTSAVAAPEASRATDAVPAADTSVSVQSIDNSESQDTAKEDIRAIEDEIEIKEMYAYHLESESLAIDSEMRRCQRARGNWKAATILGGIGTVGSVGGIIIQSAQIANAQKEGKTEQKQETGKDE